MKILIDNGQGPIDYTRYVVDGTLSIEDSINVPTLITFTLAAVDAAFQIPKRSGYVSVVSEYYATGGGYYSGHNTPLPLATGFITNETERAFLGLSGRLTGPAFGGQQLSYSVNVTSDEWQLNSRALPYIPAFVNQTMGQILGNLAEALMPGFFDVTSFVGSGDLVPYYQYSSDQTWSDIAKDFGDSVRYHYKVINRKLYFLPFGDTPSGISYDDTGPLPEKNTFALQLDTGVITIPPVNDCIVLGGIEPQTNWEDHFVGDGFTSNFQLRHQVFDGGTALLLEDDWTEDTFDTSTWVIEDPLGIFDLIGQLNVIQEGQTTPLGEEYILGINGIELGGGLNIQHGNFEFVDTCTGIVGGIYINPTLSVAGNCLAGFNLTPSGTIIVTASGAAGIIIQPLYNGVPVGPQVVSQANHQYTLQTWIGADRWDRYQRIYRNLTGSVAYGGNALSASGTITWVITDLDQGVFASTPSYQQQFILPQVTKYTVVQQNLPEFVLYAPINAINLNLTLQYTLVAQPPQGTLNVRALTGATGLQLPILPENLGPDTHYLMGFGQQNQTATISQGTNSSTQGVPAGGGVGVTSEAQYLAFYSDTIPGVGARIKLQSWAAGQAIGRVRDPVAVANEAVISGDDGVRSAIMTNLSPLPRTSAECQLAAAASVHDQEYPQFQGTYTVETIPRRFENLCNPGVYGYPTPGRFFYCNSTVRAVSGQNFVINTSRIQVVDLKQEVLTISVDYGMDLYLEKMLVQFEERTTSILSPQDSAPTPDPIFLDQVGTAFLETLDSATVLSIQNSTVTGNSVTFDLGLIPSGFVAEVRRVDNSWGQANKDRLALISSRYFTLPRIAHDQTWYIRELDTTTGIFSQFSKAIRVNYPMIPSPPELISLTTANLTLGLNGWTSDIYGVELRIPGLSGQYLVTVPLPPPPPPPAPQPPPPIIFQVTLAQPVQAYYFNTPGANGTAPFVFPVDPASAVHTAFVNSLVFNSVSTSNEFDPNIQPMENGVLNTKGQTISTSTPWFGANENYGMILSGHLIFASAGTYQFQIDHDDGMYWAIQGATLTSQTPAYNDPFGHIKSPINGYQFTGGNVGANNVHAEGNAGNAWQDVYTVNIPASGSYPFEIAYVNWTSNQMLTVRANGLQIPPDDGTDLGVSPSYGVQQFQRIPSTPIANTQAICKPSLDGSFNSPIILGDILATTCTLNSSFAGLKLVTQASVAYPTSTTLGWYDFDDVFPLLVGNGNTTVGSVQLYKRGLWSPLASGGVVNGMATVYTGEDHGFSAGDVVLVGAGWTPNNPPSISSQDAAFFTGQRTLTAIPAPNAFQFMVSSDSPQNFDVYGLAGVAAQLATAGQTGGTTNPAPTGVSYILSASGVLLQRPVFAPSDLVFDLTDPGIQQFLDVAQALNPSGNFATINAYFFNLLWDYSLPLNVTNVSAPTISGLTVDPITMNASWQILSGQPTGHRIETIDPVTGVTYNRFTIDHAENPQRLTQFQLSPSDFYNNRLIVVTPFNSLGDGLSIGFNNPAGGVQTGPPGTTNPNTNGYSIGCTWSGFIPASQLLVQLPLDQQIQYAQDMAPSQGYMAAPPQNDMVFSILLNKQQVGTMTFAAGGQRAVFSATPFTVNFMDVLEVIAPLTTDVLAQNLGFVLSSSIALVAPNVPMQLVLTDDGSGDWQDFIPSFGPLQPAISIFEQMVMSDGLAKNIVSSQLQEVLSDTLTITDAFTKNLTNNVLTLNLSDTMSLSDSVALKLPVLVQKASGTSTAVFGSNVKAGNAIIVAMGNSGSTVSSVTDTLGNTYVQVSGVASTATGPLATDIWWCASSVGGGANTVTVTWAAASSPSCQAFEVSGLTGSVDVSGKVTNGSGVGTGVSLVGTANYDFYVEMCYPTHSVASISSPWTLTTVQNGGAAGYLVAGGTQQPTFTFNTGSNFPISAAAFK